MLLAVAILIFKAINDDSVVAALFTVAGYTYGPLLGLFAFGIFTDYNIKDKYEEHHSVTYTDEAIAACVNLTSRYITDRHLPDKAIDAMDEVGSRVHLNNITVPDEILQVEEEIEKIKDILVESVVLKI